MSHTDCGSDFFGGRGIGYVQSFDIAYSSSIYKVHNQELQD